MNFQRLKKFFPWLVLLAGLTCTYFLKQWVLEGARKDLRIKFEKQALELVRQLEQRLEVQILVLRGASGFISSTAHVTPEEFHDYIASLRLQKSNPGVLGIGFALSLQHKRPSSHPCPWLRQMHQLHSGSAAELKERKSAILYIEPSSERLQSMIGHDMYADPARRTAMDMARDLQQPGMTGKIQLLRDAGDENQYGFLMYYPVYHHNMPKQTLTERRDNLLGWVFSPFRANDLVAGVLATHGEGMRISLFATDLPSEASRLTQPPPSIRQHDDHRGLTYERHMEYAGQRWLVRVHALPSYGAHLDWSEIYIVQIAGAIISLLLFLYVWTLSRSRQQAETTAMQMTKDLRESEYRWQFAVEGQGDGLWDYDLRQNTVFFSRRWKEMLGYTEEEIGKVANEWNQRIHPDDRQETLAALQNFLSGRSESYVSEHRLLCKDGSWKWILDRGMVVTRASDGHALRAIGTHTDITPRKLAEARIHRLTQLYLAISHVNQAIVRAQDEEQLFEAICRIAVEHGGMKMAWVGMLDQRNTVIHSAAAYGMSDDYRSGMTISLAEYVLAGNNLGSNPFARAALEGQANWCQDVLADPILSQWHPRATEGGWQAVATLPIYKSKEIVGILAFYASEKNAFDEEVRDLLLEISQDLSAALDNFRLEAERKQAELALRESEARYSALFGDNSVVMLLIDPEDGAIVDANGQACRFYGWDVETLRKMNIREINTLQPEQLRPEMILALKEQKQHFFFRHRRAAGDEREVEVFAGPVTIGGKTLVLSSIHDISERRLAEQALRDSETLNTTILDSLSEHIALLDDKGSIVSVNNAWVTFANTNGLPMSSQDWIGVNYLEACAHALGTDTNTLAEQAMSGIQSVLSGAASQFEMEYPCHSENEQRWFIMRVTPLHAGRSGVVVAHENITRRKLSEIEMRASHARLTELSAELIAAQEKERKNLARELHDELGQKFTTLNIRLHQIRHHLQNKQAEALWQDANDEVSDLIERVRSMSGSLRPPMLDHLGLEASVSQLLKTHFANTEIEYIFEYAGLPKRLPDQMEITIYRIVQEGITNILRYAEASRVIVEINGGENAEAIEVLIRDNGKGIDLADVGASSKGRSGYGLIGMTERVRLLGGTLEVESAPGNGTRITVSLPLKQ